MPTRARALMNKGKESLNKSLDTSLTAINKRKLDKSEYEENEYFNATISKRAKPGMVELLKCKLDTITSRTRHSVLPAFNVGQWPVLDYNELSTFPTCRFSAAQPIYVANRHCTPFDLCFRRTHAHEYHKQLLFSTRTRYQNQLKNDKRQSRLESNGIYRYNVFNFAERLASNPDPFFRGAYDYYYTGGNLSVFPNTQQVVHADGADLRNLIVSNYTTKMQARLKPICVSEKLAEKSEIFEVEHFHSSSDPNCFVVRERNGIMLNTLQEKENDSEEYILQTPIRFNAKVPFISFSHVPHSPEKLLVSNMRQQLRLYDFQNSEPQQRHIYNLGYDAETAEHQISWNAVRAYNDNTFCYVNQQQLILMDLRTPVSEWVHSECRKTHSDLPCDHISALAVSKIRPLLYVGTNHHLHCLDVRHLHANLLPQSAVCSWTHQMNYAPVFIDTLRHNENEYIALSSQVAGELRVCELQQLETTGNYSTAQRFKTTCLPYQPPTLKEAYDRARLSGYCLQAQSDLPNRLLCCTTGLAILNQEHLAKGKKRNKTVIIDENVKHIALLLTSNSIGDVFAHTISVADDNQQLPPQIRADEHSDQIMHEFANEICNKVESELQYSVVLKDKGLSRIFRCKALSKKAQNEDNDKLTRRRYGRWQKSMNTLQTFKDALAEDLLSIWDIENENEQNVTVSGLEPNLKSVPEAKTLVNNWLELGTIMPPVLSSIPSQEADLSYSFTMLTQNDDSMIDLPQSTQVAFATPLQNIEIVDMKDVSLFSQILDVSQIHIPEAQILSFEKQQPMQLNESSAENTTITAAKESVRSSPRKQNKQGNSTKPTPIKKDQTPSPKKQNDSQSFDQQEIKLEPSPLTRTPKKTEHAVTRAQSITMTTIPTPWKKSQIKVIKSKPKVKKGYVKGF